MDIFQKIAQLELPDGEYVVVGGGVLVALGLLAWDEDVDIAVSPAIFEQLKAQGWRQEAWAGKPVLKHDVYDVGVAFGDWELSDLQEDAMIINGQPFISLSKILAWKQAMGRPKDLDHIKLIKKYLQEHPQQA